MKAKRLGKALLNLKEEYWYVRDKPDKYLFNRRLIDPRPELKEIKSAYKKELMKPTPSMRKPVKRKGYFDALEARNADRTEALRVIYDDLLKESFDVPVLLRREREYTARAVWRFCLFKGFIYEFDKADYSDEEMKAEILKLEEQRPAGAS